MIIACKIDVKKIDKNLLFVGQKGTYLDITLKENQDGVDSYGNSGFIVQDVSKEARAAGERGPIIGNYREIGKKPSAPKEQPPQSQGRRPSAPPPRPPVDPDLDSPEDDIPFRSMLPVNEVIAFAKRIFGIKSTQTT